MEPDSPPSQHRPDRISAGPDPCPLVPSSGRGRLRWPTRVELAWSPRALFVRFDCRDDFAWATFRQRDQPLWQEEVVEVFLGADPAHGSTRGPDPLPPDPLPPDPRRYWEVQVNPLGALFDARVDSPRLERATMRVEPGWDWPGIRWRVGPGAGPRTPERARDERSTDDWHAELELPWIDGEGRPWASSSILPRLWRANFFRIERPGGPPGQDQAPGDDSARDEYAAWSPTGADPPDFHRPTRFGLLVLAGIDGRVPRRLRPATEQAEARGLPVLTVPAMGPDDPHLVCSATGPPATVGGSSP